MKEREPAAKIRVMLADTSEFTLIGLKQVLGRESDIEIVATCDDGEDLVTRTAELEPDVVVTEIDLPRLSGDKAAQRIRRDEPHVAVVILAARDDEQDLFDAIRGGAAAYLPKDTDPKDLLDTIRRVNQGAFLINETIYSRPNVATRVLAEFRDLSVYGPGASRVFAPLSPREVQILDHISQGKTNKEVAYSLAISEQTVKNHMSSILRKLSVNDRTQAVVYAMRQGWIKGPEVAVANGTRGMERGR